MSKSCTNQHIRITSDSQNKRRISTLSKLFFPYYTEYIQRYTFSPRLLVPEVLDLVWAACKSPLYCIPCLQTDLHFGDGVQTPDRRSDARGDSSCDPRSRTNSRATGATANWAMSLLANGSLLQSRTASKEQQLSVTLVVCFEFWLFSTNYTLKQRKLQPTPWRRRRRNV